MTTVHAHAVKGGDRIAVDGIVREVFDNLPAGPFTVIRVLVPTGTRSLRIPKNLRIRLAD